MICYAKILFNLFNSIRDILSQFLKKDFRSRDENEEAVF